MQTLSSLKLGRNITFRNQAVTLLLHNIGVSNIRYGSKNYDKKGHLLQCQVCVWRSHGGTSSKVVNLGRLVLDAWEIEQTYDDEGVLRTEVDHINHDPSDNRLENLRWATRKENIANRRKNNPTWLTDQEVIAKRKETCTLKRLTRLEQKDKRSNMNNYEINIIRNRNKELHIEVSKHIYESEFKSNKYGYNRICFYLKNEDNAFVDSFDIDYFHGKIRFYGSTKHYSVNKVPSYIKKLWRCDDFDYMILEVLDKTILHHEEHSFMYDLLVDTKFSILDNSN